MANPRKFTVKYQLIVANSILCVVVQGLFLLYMCMASAGSIMNGSSTTIVGLGVSLVLHLVGFIVYVWSALLALRLWKQFASRADAIDDVMGPFSCQYYSNWYKDSPDVFWRGRLNDKNLHGGFFQRYYLW